MQVKEENGNYICLKHNQMILLIVMDKGIQLADQMLCLKCMQFNRQPLNQVVGVLIAKEIIKEKLYQKTAGQDEKITQKLNRLRVLQSNMNELRQQFLKNIDNITRMIEQWISDLSQLIKKENIDLIKGLQLLQQEQVKVVEQNNTYISKIDSGFKKLLNIDRIQKFYQDLQNISNNRLNNHQKKNNNQMFNNLRISNLIQLIINQLVKSSKRRIVMQFHSTTMDQQWLQDIKKISKYGSLIRVI